MSLITDYLESASRPELHQVISQIQEILFEKHAVDGFLTIYSSCDRDGINQSVVRQIKGIEGKIALMAFLDVEKLEMILSIKKEQDRVRSSNKETS